MSSTVSAALFWGVLLDESEFHDAIGTNQDWEELKRSLASEGVAFTTGGTGEVDIFGIAALDSLQERSDYDHEPLLPPVFQLVWRERILNFMASRGIAPQEPGWHLLVLSI